MRVEALLYEDKERQQRRLTAAAFRITLNPRRQASQTQAMKRHEYVLGLSAYYHDSAAALLERGTTVAAAQEERFSRKKHDSRFPVHALTWCLQEADVDLTELEAIVFYDKPLLKFERLLETYMSYAPRGIRSFTAAMPVWLKEKLYLKEMLKKEFAACAECKREALPQLLFAEHHQSHAASAFYPGPFREAAVLCMDGVGEWATTSVWVGKGNRLTPLWQINFPHSLGLLYSAFTYFTGFRVNSGEYKLMGLAPYGEPRYADTIREHLVDVKEDGTFRLNMDFFDYCTGLRMTNRRFNALFDGPPRQPESAITQREMDIAASIQTITEDVVLRLARSVHRETGSKYLCLAGGVALNCVANGRLVREGPFDDLWIQPAAGDAGGAIGAAAAAWHEYFGNERICNGSDGMRGAFLGPKYGAFEIRRSLGALGARYHEEDEAALLSRVVQQIEAGKVVGWFQGRMEFGPRALGGRSILGDPRNPKMQSVMNLKIKYRESFRPFAPSVLAESVSQYFELDRASPYMLLVAPVKTDLRKTEQQALFGIDRLKLPRSSLPAVTHVDYSARVQTVHEETNPRYYRLLKEFERRTGCGVLVNTSFNVRGEPIVCTPEDAYRCFMRTEMDFLVLENCILDKQEQPQWRENEGWREELELD
ncbi:MAG: carbamoyltransferase [Woeseia sp.]